MGTCLIDIGKDLGLYTPIDSNRFQLSSGNSRIMFVFVHFVHSMNQGEYLALLSG